MIEMRLLCNGFWSNTNLIYSVSPQFGTVYMSDSFGDLLLLLLFFLIIVNSEIADMWKGKSTWFKENQTR